MKRVVHLSVLLTLMLYSCSVKEDRLSCPCHLTVEVSDFKGYSDGVKLGLKSGALFLRDSLALTGDESSYHWTAKKGSITAFVYSGLQNSMEIDGVVTIPVGMQADSLRAYSETFECYEETKKIITRANRQTAFVCLRFVTYDGSAYPYQLQLSGNINGIDLRDMTVLEGEFRCDISLDDNNASSFYLPRQTEDSEITIKVYDQDRYLTSLPLYEWIQKADYDWLSPDLPRLSIVYDVSCEEVFVEVDDWEEGKYYDEKD